MYIAITVGKDNYANLGDYFVREGLADRITPFNTKKSGRTVDTEKMYDNMMNRFRYGGLDNPNFYLDETVSRMCYTHRRMFAQLATQLMAEGKTDKANKLVHKAEQALPPTTLPHSFAGGSLDLAACGLSWVTRSSPRPSHCLWHRLPASMWSGICPCPTACWCARSRTACTISTSFTALPRCCRQQAV